MPLQDPSYENNFQVSASHKLTHDLWNAVFVKVAELLRAHDAKAANWDALTAQGTAAVLETIRQTIAPQIQAEQTKLAALEAAIDLASDKLVELNAGGIESASVSVPDDLGFDGDTLKDVLSELDSDLSALGLQMATAIAAKADLSALNTLTATVSQKAPSTNPTFSGPVKVEDDILTVGARPSVDAGRGGRLELEAGSSSSINGGAIALELFNNRFRIFEKGTPYRGVYFDFPATPDGQGQLLSSDNVHANFDLTAGTFGGQSPSDLGVAVIESPLLALAAVVSFSHGLGYRPRVIWAELECIQAELGYSVGDRVHQFAQEGSYTWGDRMRSTTTEILWVSSGGGYFVVPHKLGGSGNGRSVPPGDLKWKIRLCALEVQ